MAGTKIDELVIDIRADTEKLKRDLDNVKYKLDKTGKGARRTFVPLGAGIAQLSKVAIGFGAVALTAGVLTKKIAEVAMVFEDLKDSLDVVFGSVEAGDKAMNRVFEFAQTTPFQIETATQAFVQLKSVGIEPTNEMLQVFADTASVSVDQLGVFNALVRTVQRSAGGGLGLEELNMLNDRGIPALKILQEELGLAKDDIAAFGKTTKGAKAITDSLQEGLSKRFGGAMESKMDNLSTKASNMTIAFKQLANEVFESGLGDWLKALADALTDLADATARAMAASRGEATGVKMVTAQFGKDATPEEKKQARIDAARANIDALKTTRTDVEDVISGKNIIGIAKTAHATKKARGGFADEENRIKLINAAIKEQNDLIDRLIEGKGLLSDEEKESLMRQGEMINAFNFVNAEVVKSIGDTDKLAFAMDNLSEIYQENEAAFLALGMTYKDVEKILTDISEKTEEVASAMDEFAQVITQNVNAFTTDFVNALMEGESALESFKNFAKNLVGQIIATFIQLTIVNRILNSIFGQNGVMPASNWTPLATLAGGGAVSAGTPYVVGERGPEIFVPNSSGKIMNTVRSEVTKMLPQISEVTKASVFEAATRGGQFGKAMRGGVG